MREKEREMIEEWAFVMPLGDWRIISRHVGWWLNMIGGHERKCKKEWKR
jgi:hypothetical protein